MGKRGIEEWQRDFRAGQKIWIVEDREQCPVNYYDTEAGAHIELEWRRARGDRGYRVVYANLHTEALAAERWTPIAAEAGRTPGGRT